MIIAEFHLLIIDDDEDDIVTIRDLLNDVKSNKYVITWQHSYKNGLVALREKKYDACLLDYRLGEKTGLELLREIQGEDLNCPIILLTGHGDIEVDIMAMQTGAADFLVKSQLTTPLLERSIRYSMKQTLDMNELKNSRAQILQQDRLASLGLLASSLAHEIGTPMGIIRSRAEMVAKKSGDNESLKSDMITVIQQIDKVAKLVNSLLNLAREKSSEHPGRVNLNQVIEDVLNLVQHEFSRKGIDFELQIEGQQFVKAEAGPLGQVLLNLLVNAIHAVEDAKESGSQRTHKILISVETTAANVDLSVSDTGCGIEQKHLSQLFKPFFTTKDIGHGTGLGLATSYNLVNSWDGSISVTKNTDKGATFTVRLAKVKS